MYSEGNQGSEGTRSQAGVYSPQQGARLGYTLPDNGVGGGRVPLLLFWEFYVA